MISLYRVEFAEESGIGSHAFSNFGGRRKRMYGATDETVELGEIGHESDLFVLLRHKEGGTYPRANFVYGDGLNDSLGDQLGDQFVGFFFVMNRSGFASCGLAGNDFDVVSQLYTHGRPMHRPFG